MNSLYRKGYLIFQLPQLLNDAEREKSNVANQLRTSDMIMNFEQGTLWKVFHTTFMFGLKL